MVNSTRGAKRIGVVLGPALVVALVSAGTLWNIRDVTERESSIRHTDQVKLVAADFLEQLSTSRSAVNKFLISGDTADIAQYRVVADSATHDLVLLRTLTQDNPHQHPRLDDLGRVAAERFADIDSTIRVREARGEAAAAALSLAPSRAIMDTARRVGAALTSEEDLLLTRRTPALRRRRSITVTVLVIGTAIALLLGVLANTYLLRAAALAADTERSAPQTGQGARAAERPVAGAGRRDGDPGRSAAAADRGARSREHGQVRFPHQHVARVAHAAQRDQRVRRLARRGHPRPTAPPAARGHPAHPARQRAPARAHQ